MKGGSGPDRTRTQITEPVPRSSWFTLVTVSAAVFMVAMELTVIALALPEIRRAFPEVTESALSWVVSAYSLGVGALLLVAGWLADRHGRRRVFLIGVITFTLGSLAAGMSTSPAMLITARVVQSIGGSMQFPAGLALALTAFPRSRHQFAIGVWGAMGGLAAALGPSLGALLISGFGWRSVFLVNVPVAVAVLVVGPRILIESTGGDLADRRVEIVSVPLASLGVGSVILGIVQGQSWGWGSTSTSAAFGAGAVMLAVFVARSLRHPEPLFDLRLFRLRSWTVGILGTLLFSAAYFSLAVLLPSFVQETWRWSVIETGLAIAPGPFLSFLIPPYAGRLADRIGNAPILMVGAGFGVAGMAWFLVTLTVEPRLDHFLIGNLLIGVAAGLCFAQLVGATLRDVPAGMYARAGAGRTTIFQLTLAMAVALAFTMIGEPEGSGAMLAAYRRVWVVSLVCFVGLFAVFAFMYPRRDRLPAVPAATRPTEVSL